MGIQSPDPAPYLNASDYPWYQYVVDALSCACIEQLDGDTDGTYQNAGTQPVVYAFMFSSMSGKRNVEVAKIELSCGRGVVKGRCGKQLW